MKRLAEAPADGSLSSHEYDLASITFLWPVACLTVRNSDSTIFQDVFHAEFWVDTTGTTPFDQFKHIEPTMGRLNLGDGALRQLHLAGQFTLRHASLLPPDSKQFRQLSITSTLLGSWYRQAA